LQGVPEAVQVGRITVVAWPAQRARAIALAELADQPTSWPGLGRRDPGPLRLIIAPAERLAALSRGRLPPWGAGLAYPSARTILLRADSPDLVATLRHELAHLALHQAVTVRLPLWFDEGYATWASGQWDVFDRLSINLAVARGEIPTLRELDAALRGSRVTADAAYALAASAALEVARRNPTGTLDPLLAHLEQGDGFEQALLATTGMDADRFEESWRRSVRTRFGLFTWLAATGFWFTVSGFVVLAYLLRRHRDEPRRVALDTDWEVPDWEVGEDVPTEGFGASTGQDTTPEPLSAEGSRAVDREGPEG
jgi:hypothetical protein